MISIYHWDPDRKCCERLDASALSATTARQVAEGDVWWIDLDAPTAEEERLAFEYFLPIHPLTFEDITKTDRDAEQRPHFPKVEEFPDYLFVIVNPLRPELLAAPGKRPRGDGGKQGINLQLSAVLTHTVLVTHHYEPLPVITRVHEYLERHGEHADRGPDYLFHLILDGMVDEYAPVVDRIIDSLDRIESRVIHKPSNRNMIGLLHLKRTIVVLRKTLILEREVLARLTRGEFRLVDTREIAYYRNVYDHLVRYTELIEGAREMVSDLMQTHLAVVSNNLNSIMKVLAMISTVILPVNLIASIYGMNFKHIPELDWQYGYPWALALMATAASIAIGFFFWKGWLGGGREDRS